MKNIIYIFCFFGMIPWVVAQQSTGVSKKAERVYKNLGYAEFIALEGDADITQADKNLLNKLGTSYRKLSDFKNAEKVYQRLVELEQGNGDNHLYYAQALQANGNYVEARKQYQIVKDEQQADGEVDERAIEGYKACAQIPTYKAKGKVEVKNEVVLNGPDLDFSPMFHEGGLVYVSNRSNASGDQIDEWLNANCMDLYYAKQEGEVFENPTAFSDQINTKFHEGPVTFTDDDQKIFFTRNNFLNGKRGTDKERITKLKVYSARKIKGIWKEIEELKFNDRAIDICHPALSPDERMLVFASSHGEGSQGGMDLYVSYLIGNSWSSPVNLGPEINTPGNEVFPYIHTDGSLYFSSNGRAGIGGLDIYMAHKKTEGPDAIWEVPLNLGAPFNSKKDDFGFIMRPDNKTGYFTSSRTGGQGQDDIYSFVAENSMNETTPAPMYPMQLCVFDKATNERIQGAELTIKPISETGEMEDINLSQLDGATMVLSLTPIEEGSNEYRIKLNDLTKDQKAQLGLMYTDDKGVAPIKMEAGKSYKIQAKKNGYVLATETFRMPLRGGEVEEYCIGLLKLDALLASGGKPSPDKSSPYYDPKMDPNSPDYDPEYAELIAATPIPNDPNNPTSGNPNPTYPPGTPHVKGIVLHDEYGRPIPRTDVTLLNRCTGEEVVVKVDRTGLFSFPLECGCEYVVKARKDNFVGANQIISLIDPKDCEEPVALELLMAPGFDKLGNPLTVGGTKIRQSIKAGDVIELKNIYYDFDQYYIRSEAAGDLDDLAFLMQTFPSMEIELSSHTDARATDSYNRTLSSNRAKSAKEYLMKKGIAGNRIKAVGYGESRPRNKCKDGVECSEYEHQVNRRTEVFVTKFDKTDYIKVKYDDNKPTIVDPKK
jgi:outer membrane protein OmpA-like peptidoglycan-associated protein/tetratricopeptide (TPR) repeat protein